MYAKSTKKLTFCTQWYEHARDLFNLIPEVL